MQRLEPPLWRRAPAAADFGRLAALDPARGAEACHLNARLFAAELHDLAIDVNCLPLLDVRDRELHHAIGDRAFSEDPKLVAKLGRAAAEGLLAGGVLPVMKHLPGHGRARVDSHLSLPRAEATEVELSAVDFAPFRELADLPLAMTGHLLYPALDAVEPATTSTTIIETIIRGQIGFKGLLMTDDISMQALQGDIGERTRKALEAGCDVVLHCNARQEEMALAVANAGPMSEAATTRAVAGLALRRPPEPFDGAEAMARLTALLAPLGAEV